jgi:hypothetical protein
MHRIEGKQQIETVAMTIKSERTNIFIRECRAKEYNRRGIATCTYTGRGLLLDAGYRDVEVLDVPIGTIEVIKEDIQTFLKEWRGDRYQIPISGIKPAKKEDVVFIEPDMGKKYTILKESLTSFTVEGGYELPDIYKEANLKNILNGDEVYPKKYILERAGNTEPNNGNLRYIIRFAVKYPNGEVVQYIADAFPITGYQGRRFELSTHTQF